MGELLDRVFQRELLGNLTDLYPQSCDIQRSFGRQDDNRLLVNLSYLAEHGLLKFSKTQLLDGQIRMHSATITAAGMDFIADDGGLSAILGVVTVKLHDDTIRQLLIKKVEQADGDKTIKASLIAKIKELPAEALGAVAMSGLDAALGQAPNVISLLRNLLPI